MARTPVSPPNKTSSSPKESPRGDRLLNIVILASLIFVIGAGIYIVTVPKTVDKFTEFYILNETGKAEGYPHDLVVGETYRIIIGIGNHERRDMNYTIEIDLMNMTIDSATNATIADNMTTVERFQVVVPDSTTLEFSRGLTIPQGTYNRLEFLMFKDTTPDDTVWLMERINASYRDLYLQIITRK